jgi:outer membrane protein assembly factor BamB
MRLQFGSLVLLPLLLVSAFSQVPAVAPGVAVTYQINARHTGSIQTPGLIAPLSIKWSVNLGATVGYALIAQNKVFVLAGDSNANTVNLYALSAATGQIVWGPVNIPAGAYWWAAAAYDKGTIYVVPSTTTGFDNGAIYAYSAEKGNLLWTAILAGQALFTSAPSVGNSMIYTAGAGVGGTLYAIREKDGSVAWTANAEGNSSSPAVTASSVYVSYTCPQTNSFDALNGTPLWSYAGPCSGGGGATPAFYQGDLYIRNAIEYPTTGLQLNAYKGTVIGGFDASFIPAFLGNTAFYNNNGNTLSAVTLPKQKPLWTVNSPAGDLFSTPPIAVNTTVYVCTSSGVLYGYNAADGSIVTSLPVGAPVAAYELGGVSSPLAGLNAAESMIVVPASTYVVAVH